MEDRLQDGRREAVTRLCGVTDLGPTGAKDYNVILCRYNIENGQMGRWIIEKFEEIK